MAGIVIDAQVIIPDEAEANQNYNKGYFGQRQGSQLNLDLIEATFLQETGRITIEKDGKKLSLPELMNFGIAQHPNFEIGYLVYRDLRRRGYIIRLGKNHQFNLYPRGGAPHSHQPKYEVKALSERRRFAIDDLIHWIKTGTEKKQKIILGLVDEEGDLTYYIAQLFIPKGNLDDTPIKKGQATLLDDRAMVWNKKLAHQLQKRAIGRNFDDNGAVQLSLLETAYLMEENLHVVRDHAKLTYNEFMDHATMIQPDIQFRIRTYRDLRKKGMVAKTGFKFGSHFRVYKGEGIEGHAPFLVHVVPRGFTSTWTEISRAIRLAHSVKKQMVFSRDGDQIDYVKIRRITP